MSEEQLRNAISDAMEFLEEEAENRASAGGAMSDYEREPMQIFLRLQAALECLAPSECPACGACPGFIGAECTGDCGWEQ